MEGVIVYDCYDSSSKSSQSSPREAVTVVLVVNDLIYGISFGEEEDAVSGLIRSAATSIKYVSVSLGYLCILAALLIDRRKDTNLSLNV